MKKGVIASQAEAAGVTERQYVTDILTQAGSVYGAARNIGVYPTTLIQIMKRLGLKLETSVKVVEVER